MPCSSALRPLLTEHHKLLMRTLFCVTKVNSSDNGLYKDHYQSTNVDEKWFFITESHLCLYLVPGEEKPDCWYQNNEHNLNKVMFLLGDVARPGYDHNGICTFDGKIGLFPFIERVVAQQRTSDLLPWGTIIARPVSVNWHRYWDCLNKKATRWFLPLRRRSGLVGTATSQYYNKILCRHILMKMMQHLLLLSLSNQDSCWILHFWCFFNIA